MDTRGADFPATSVEADGKGWKATRGAKQTSEGKGERGKEE